MWSNAKLYNPSGTPVHTFANELSALFERETKELRRASEDDQQNLAKWLCERLEELPVEQQTEAVRISCGENTLEHGGNYELDLGSLSYKKLIELKAFVESCKGEKKRKSKK